MIIALFLEECTLRLALYFLQCLKPQGSPHNRIGFITLVLASLLFLVLTTVADATQEASPPKRFITVAIASDLSPHSFVDTDGELKGARPEFWRLWSLATHIDVRFLPISWGEAIDIVVNGKADVIDPVFFSPRLLPYLDLSEPTYHSVVHAFFNKDILGINDAQSLHGFAVGVYSHGVCKDWMAEQGIKNVHLYSTLEAMIQGALHHETEVFCAGRVTGFTYLTKLGIADQFRISPPLYSSTFHWGVRKGKDALFTEIQQGFDKIPKEDVDAINQKWFGASVSSDWSDDHIRQAIIVALIGLAVVLVLVIWNQMLRRRVAVAVGEYKAIHTQLRTISDRDHLFAALALQSVNAIVLIDCETLRFVEFNDAACDRLGYRLRYGAFCL